MTIITRTILVVAILMSASVLSEIDPTVLGTSGHVVEMPSMEDLTESIRYLSSSAKKNAGESAPVTIVFEHALSAEDLADWLDACLCEVNFVTYYIYFRDEASTDRNAHQVTDFDSRVSSASERLTLIQSAHLEARARLDAKIMEGMQNQLTENLDTSEEQGAQWIGFAIPSGAPDPELLEQAEKADHLMSAWFVYPEIGATATYGQLLRLQFTPQVAWVKPSTQKGKPE
jgi:hypothetical protein